MEQIIQLNANAKLSEHFTLGEFTKSGSHPEVYNIPSHEAIANLTNLCKWLEVLRLRAGTPIRINSGYRSPQLNKAIHGVAGSNHMTGCASDIRVENMEQLIRDELLIERNSHGAIWLHFAVRPSGNRHKVAFINA